MNATELKIAAGLERAFAQKGFAEPNIEELRVEANVSLRTLYKYMPSRDDMVLAALEHRHRRYLKLLFDDLSEDPKIALDQIISRVTDWMRTESPHGCLFQAAVSAAPENQNLRDLLARHKDEIARKAAEATGLTGSESDLLLVLEGLIQCWPMMEAKAEASARRLAGQLYSAD